jgi:hypothetical protein
VLLNEVLLIPNFQRQRYVNLSINLAFWDRNTESNENLRINIRKISIFAVDMATNVHNWIFRAVFAFCAVALMLGALPHHHHDGSQAVCFNPTHCFTHSDNYSDCCDHDHCSSEQDATGEHSSCHLKIDVAEVISQLSKQSLLPPVQLQTLVAEPFEVLALIECKVEHLDYQQLLLPDPAQRIVRYIARALPTRATTERA